MADRTTGSRKQLPVLSGSGVIQEVVDKAARLTREVRPLGQPRATQADVIGALVYVATAESAAEALRAYNPLLGRALEELED